MMLGQSVRKLIKDGLIIRKPHLIHSRSRVRRAMEAKKKGRHSGKSMKHPFVDDVYFSAGTLCT